MDVATTGAIIAGVSALISFASAVSIHWERKRNLVAEPWSALVSTDVARARRTVARAAHTQTLSCEEQREFIDAAFRLLWELQRVDIAISTIKNTALGSTEAKWLYRQIESIHPDLQDAITKHGSEVNWEPSLQYTNEVLASLPGRVKDSWERTLIKQQFESIEAPFNS